MKTPYVSIRILFEKLVIGNFFADCQSSAKRSDLMSLYKNSFLMDSLMHSSCSLPAHGYAYLALGSMIDWVWDLID